MTHLAGEAIMSVDQLTAHDDTATDTCTESDLDEVLHTARCAISHFADGCCVGVVRQDDRDLQLLLEQPCEWDLVLPGEIGGKFDRPIEVIPVGSSDADTEDLVHRQVDLDQVTDSHAEVLDVVSDVEVLTGLDGAGTQDISSCVHDPEGCIGATEVDPYDVGLGLYSWFICHGLVPK